MPEARDRLEPLPTPESTRVVRPSQRQGEGQPLQKHVGLADQQCSLGTSGRLRLPPARGRGVSRRPSRRPYKTAARGPERKPAYGLAASAKERRIRRYDAIVRSNGSSVGAAAPIEAHAREIVPSLPRSRRLRELLGRPYESSAKTSATVAASHRALCDRLVGATTARFRRVGCLVEPRRRRRLGGKPLLRWGRPSRVLLAG